MFAGTRYHSLECKFWKTEKYIRELLVGLVEKQVRARDFSAEDLQEDLADSGVVVECTNCAVMPAKSQSWRKSFLKRQKPELHPHQKTVHINIHLDQECSDWCFPLYMYKEAISKYHKPFNKITSPVTEGQHLQNLLFLSHSQLNKQKNRIKYDSWTNNNN